MRLDVTILVACSISLVLSNSLGNLEGKLTKVRARRHISELKMSEYLSQMNDICNRVNCDFQDIMMLGKRTASAERRSVSAYRMCCRR